MSPDNLYSKEEAIKIIIFRFDEMKSNRKFKAWCLENDLNYRSMISLFSKKYQKQISLKLIQKILEKLDYKISIIRNTKIRII